MMLSLVQDARCVNLRGFNKYWEGDGAAVGPNQMMITVFEWKTSQQRKTPVCTFQRHRICSQAFKFHKHIVTWSSIVASIIFLAMYSHFSISAEIYGWLFHVSLFPLLLVFGVGVFTTWCCSQNVKHFSDTSCISDLNLFIACSFWPSKIYHQKQKEVQKSLFGECTEHTLNTW